MRVHTAEEAATELSKAKGPVSLQIQREVSWRPTKGNKKPPKALKEENKKRLKQLESTAGPQLQYHNSTSATAAASKDADEETAETCMLLGVFCCFGAAAGTPIEV